MAPGLALGGEAETNLLSAGTNAPATAALPEPARTNEVRLTVDDAPHGLVLRVSTKARFATLSFPLARLPEPGQYLDVWRTNSIVGQVRVSGPGRDEVIIADLVAGDCQSGDEVTPPRPPPTPPAPPPPKPAVTNPAARFAFTNAPRR